MRVRARMTVLAVVTCLTGAMTVAAAVPASAAATRYQIKSTYWGEEIEYTGNGDQVYVGPTSGGATFEREDETSSCRAALGYSSGDCYEYWDVTTGLCLKVDPNAAPDGQVVEATCKTSGATYEEEEWYLSARGSESFMQDWYNGNYLMADPDSAAVFAFSPPSDCSDGDSCYYWSLPS
jgi:hypothetical protein